MGGDKRINDLLFHSLYQRYYQREIKGEDVDLFTSNLVRLEMLSLFPNCKTVIIQSTCYSGYYSYSFSLMALLNVISQSNVDQIIIKSKEKSGYNWIKSLWKSDEQILKKEYSAKGYEIEMKQKEKKEYH